MNFIEKIILSINPDLALKRTQSRLKIDFLENKRDYEAASQSRRGDGWNPVNYGGGVNSDIQKSLHILRERSVNSYKNNSSAFSAHRKIQNNVVGTGMMPTPVNKAGEKPLSKAEIDIIKSEWKAFSESIVCDFNDRMHFGGIQSLVMRTISMQGECLVMRRRDSDFRIPFQIQVLPPHMMDAQKNTYQVDGRDGNFIVSGVEFNAKGKKVGYWIYDSDPRNQYTMKITSSFFPVTDLKHIFYQDFPEQVRGTPFGTPAMLNMRDLDDYEDAQLMLQKISACHTAFTTKPSVEDESMRSDREYETSDHLEPGMITELAPGEEVTFNNPPTPGGYNDYVTKNQMKNASGFGISYEAYAGDYSRVNFSSGRMGWIEMGRQVEDWQYNLFIPQFLEPVWDWFIEGLFVRNIINKKAAAEWTPPGREMIDPAKEVAGIVSELKAGLISWTEACKKRGYNPESMLEQIKADKEMFEKAGINVEWIIEEVASEAAPGDKMNAEDLKRILDAYGVGVRAGTITPTEKDEEFFRKLSEFPEMTQAVIDSWKEDGGFRRPITLAVAKENNDFQA